MARRSSFSTSNTLFDMTPELLVGGSGLLLHVGEPRFIDRAIRFMVDDFKNADWRAGGLPMVNFIRASSLEGFAELVMRAGADPVRLCEAAGIPAAALTAPDIRVRSDATGVLLDLAARQTGIDDLGLRLACCCRSSCWGAVGLLLVLL